MNDRLQLRLLMCTVGVTFLFNVVYLFFWDVFESIPLRGITAVGLAKQNNLSERAII